MSGRPVWIDVANGGITTPRGFLASGIAAGIKAQGLDLAILLSEGPRTTAAGVFTTNLVKAAPILVSEEHLRRTRGRCRAVVVNSGNANAATGKRGLRDAEATARATGSILGRPAEEILVASTGVIGRPLPVRTLARSLPGACLALDPAGGSKAARAILTTDTFPKEHAVRLGGKGSFAVGGMAKGAGMIHPAMATMLAFLTTDLAVPAPLLRRALREAVEPTFNRISVDGDTSTNDCVFALAGGASGLRVRSAGDPLYRVLVEGLTRVSRKLALDIVRDGEGATKLVTLRVTGAPTKRAALQVARTIATSLLVKTALYGEQANWGRILAAAGRAGVRFDPDRAVIAIGGKVVFRKGLPTGIPDADLAPVLKSREYEVVVDLRAGTAEETVTTCDLSHRYVDINGSYLS